MWVGVGPFTWYRDRVTTTLDLYSGPLVNVLIGLFNVIKKGPYSFVPVSTLWKGVFTRTERVWCPFPNYTTLFLLKTEPYVK